MNPKARQDEIVVQEVFDELVIYDLKRDKVHSLNPTAALVWQHCDGQRSPADLAALLQQRYDVPKADALLWLTLDRLEKAHLLTGKVASDNGHKVVSRRKVLKMVGVSIALLPVVATIVAPQAQAVNSLLPAGSCCSTDNECINLCNVPVPSATCTSELQCS